MTKTTDSTKAASKLNDAALVLSKKRRPKAATEADDESFVSNHSNMDSGFSPSQETNRESDTLDISEILTKRYGGISVYAAVMVLLAIGIVWSAVLTAEQVQQYHQDYMMLQNMKKEHRRLEIEHQRLIIEQQTFSATPYIASRAISELSMYSPSTKDKLILQPEVMTSNTSVAASLASNSPKPQGEGRE